MKTIQFKNVGRDKLTWQAQVKEADEASIVQAVKAKGALLSREVFAEAGHIYAGFRLVGHYTVLGEEIALAQ